MKLLHLKESVDITFAAEAEEARDKARKIVESKGGVLIPTIEAIHSSVTRNRTFYGPAKLKGKPDYTAKETNIIRPTGVHSWTKPFAKPMLLNHDIEVDPLGRITRAEYKNKTSTGVPGVVCYPEITDPEAAIKILDGRYKTVSVGADTNAAVCSICGKNMLEEWCDHRRGQMYEGKLCFWSIGDVWFAELSFVNAPSDENAGVIEIPDVKESTGVQLGLLIQDLKENRLYDLTNDQIYTASREGLTLIPHSEYMQEYFYVPFNIQLDESGVSASTETDIGRVAIESIPDDLEKGGTLMPKIKTNENIPAEGAQVKEEQETVTEAVEATSDDKVAELETQVESLKDTISSMREQIKTLVISPKEESNTEEAHEEEVTQEETEEKVVTLESVQTENATLVEQNAALKAQILKYTAEKIVGLKVELGDLTLEQKESEMEALVARNEESLADTLQDLQARKAAKPIVVEKVTNPGLADNSQTGVFETTANDSKSEKTEEKLDTVGVFKRLLVGSKK